MKKMSATQLATAIAIIFHTVGLTGILIFNSGLIIRSTPLNLLLSFALLLCTAPAKNQRLWLLTAACIITGITVEVIGVNSGWLFGNYQYGPVLGFKIFNAPLIIGINWFIIIYCCGNSIQLLAARYNIRLPVGVLALAAAALAVLFDWLIEPTAIKLNYWSWAAGKIPLYNYVCWYIVSYLLLQLYYQKCLPPRANKLAVNLLLIQFVFFLLLKFFL
jgi:bisanhydrobacterioruberin hydratase